MLGTIIQYALYLLFWLTVTLAVGGVMVALAAHRGKKVSLAPWAAGLALVAATAPYVGLFGTVWHIIQALSGIGGGNLNVAAIASPIGEALYATLWGLGCAIPALIAHRIVLLLAPDDEPDATQVPAPTSTEA